MTGQHTHHTDERAADDGRRDDRRQMSGWGHGHGHGPHGGPGHRFSDDRFSDDRLSVGRSSRRRFAGGDGDGRGFGPPTPDGPRGHGRRSDGRRSDGRRSEGRRSERGERGPEVGSDLRTGVRGLIGAIQQVGMVGDESQRNAALTLLGEASRSVYRILAAGPEPTATDGKAPGADGDVTTTSPAPSGEADVDDAGTGS